MAQRFAAYEKRLSEAVDRVYGETLRVEPRAVGEFVSVADPERAPYDTYGPVDFVSAIATPKAIGKNDGDSVQVAGERIHVSIHQQNLPEGAAFPRQGDLIVLRDREGEPRVRVVNPEPDGIGRYIFICVRA